jgi:hypothetical protein
MDEKIDRAMQVEYTNDLEDLADEEFEEDENEDGEEGDLDDYYNSTE